MRNIRTAFREERTESELQRIVLESFRNLGRTALEVLEMDRLQSADLGRIIRVEGEESLDSAAATGKGVIFVTAHVGNWELMGAAVARRYPLAVVAAPIYDSRLERLMISLRTGHGIQTFVRGRAGLTRRILSFLRSGGVLGILIDQDTKTDGVFVPFFGRPAYTPSGAAMLAIRTGAAVVAGFISRDGDDRHRIRIQGPLPMVQSGNLNRDIKENTALLTRFIEDQIRKTPEEWVWMHDRWRTAEKEQAVS